MSESRVQQGLAARSATFVLFLHGEPSLVDRRLSSNIEIDKRKKNEDGKQYRLEIEKGLSLEKKRKGDRYRTMSYETTQKMIHRLLTQDKIGSDGKRQERYTKKELAEELGITMPEFRKLESLSGYDSIKEKVTLPLVGLYCFIRWIDDKRKKKFYE